MEVLQDNARLKLFLPLIYMIHEDQLVSVNESNLVTKYINSQSWLTNDELKTLHKLTNPSHHLNGELIEIKNNIRKVLKKEFISQKPGLIDIGAQLTPGLSAEYKEKALAHQHVLGYLNHEAIFHFYPEWRKTESQQAKSIHSFKVESLSALLDGEHAGLIQEIKNIIRSGTFDFIHGTNLKIHREEIYKACKLLADRGYGAISYPQEYGGCGDMASYFTVMETISYSDLSMTIKYGVQFGLWGGSVLSLGTKKHHDKYLKGIGTLDIPGCFAMTETGHGSNVKGIETTATFNATDRTFIIHSPTILSTKEYIGNAAVHGQMATVFAKLILNDQNYGIAALIVPLRDNLGNILPGITIEDCGKKMGLNGIDNGTIRFNHVKVPYDALLDRFVSIDENGNFKSEIQSENRRFFTMLGTLVGGRIGVPRSALSASKVGLATTIIYSDQRKQFGPENGTEIPILNYRMHQRRLIPLLAKTYALHFAMKYITYRYQNKNDQEAQEIEAIAAGLKAYTTWHTTATLQECRECCGGKGYLSENRIDDLKNDSEIYTTFEGDNTVLMQLVAKSRLTEFKQSFHNIGITGLVSYFTNQALTSVSQKNPITVRNTDTNHLTDFEFHLNAFKYREQDMLASAAKRLKRLIDDGMDSFDAFNVCQHHLIEAAEAYVERIVLEQFHSNIQAITDNSIKKVLNSLYQLFALHTIEFHKEWYLESEYMAPSKTKAIRKLVNQLCWDIREDAVPLVEAFGIPENCLGKIARNI